MFGTFFKNATSDAVELEQLRLSEDALHERVNHLLRQPMRITAPVPAVRPPRVNDFVLAQALRRTG